MVETTKPRVAIGEEIFEMIKRGGIIGLFALVVGFILLINLFIPFLAGYFPALNNLPSSSGAIQILMLFVAAYTFLALARLYMMFSSRGHTPETIKVYLQNSKSMFWSTILIVVITLGITYAISAGWIGIDFSVLPQQFSLISP